MRREEKQVPATLCMVGKGATQARPADLALGGGNERNPGGPFHMRTRTRTRNTHTRNDTYLHAHKGKMML